MLEEDVAEEDADLLRLHLGRLVHDDDDSSSTMTHSVFDVQFQRSKNEIRSRLHCPNRIQRFVNDEFNATFIFECDLCFQGQPSVVFCMLEICQVM